MEEGTVSGICLFQGAEYVVTMTVDNDKLTMEVEDKMTSDQWKQTFSAKEIELTTERTGSFKEFSIFVNMIESAISGNNETVCLDLYTFSEVNELRKRKTGTVSTSDSNNRVLILSYTVQFDRIHYPLALPYMGKPDPRILQETIRELKQEIDALKRGGAPGHQSKDNSSKSAAKQVCVLNTMVKNLEADIVEEKARNQRAANKRNKEFKKLQIEVEELRASERNLKAQVKSLRNELAVYKGNTSARSLRTSYERPRSRNNSRDNSRLSHASNRTNSQERFVGRTSSLERKQSAAERARQYSARQQQRDRSNSRDRTAGRVYMRDRSNSLGSVRANSQERGRPISRDRLRPNSQDRGRPSSLDRIRPNSQERGRPLSRDRIRPNSQDRFRNRTPSPRFDPTAFVREKNRKRKEAGLKKNRHINRKMNGSLERKSTSSVLSDQQLNRNSSFESADYYSDTGAASETSQASGAGSRRGTTTRGKGNRSRTSFINGITSSPDVSFSSKPRSGVVRPKKKVLASTPERPTRHKTHTDEKENGLSESSEKPVYDNSEISEIDARLSRLQLLMGDVAKA